MGAESVIRRAGAVTVVTAAVLAVGGPSAGAITPPEVDPAVAPPTGNAGPVQTMAQRSECVTSGVITGSDPAGISPNLLSLNISEAWKHSRGEGQLVAVIDTGVTPGPRLPDVEGGGDFVESTDGLTDCDGHGTLVAGLIAGQPGADGFSGVAPNARLISIRQANRDVATLARAVVRAADAGARVINISTTSCVPANKNVDQGELGAALRYAAVEKDAVIVAAAGNTGGATACESNPLTDPARPSDPRNWASVNSVSIPSWWQPYVLSVGSLTTAGQPSQFAMAGPWLGIAAPGENITSVSNAAEGGLANGMPDNEQGMAPISGTGSAAAYVSGVAALVRSRFPDLTAQQVIGRISGTAHTGARSPSNLVGAGSIDPVAALTWVVPEGPESMVDPAAVRQTPAPVPPPRRIRRPVWPHSPEPACWRYSSSP